MRWSPRWGGSTPAGHGDRSSASGHYASVLALDDSTAIAICTDGVGTKLIVAEQAQRFDTVGIDCVAMNVNDLVCVGAEPIAMVDYIAVEQVDPRVLAEIGESLRAGAERAGIEIPGGELAQVPEMLQGHPSPHGVDLVGAASRHRGAGSDPDRGDDRTGRRRVGRALERIALERLHARATSAPRRRRPVARRLAGRARAHRGRGAARAHGDLRSRGARPAALGSGRSRARAHHRRRIAQPDAAERRRRLPDRRSAAAATDLRADPGPR